MKFNQALLIPALLVVPLTSCSSPQRTTCEPIPGLSHSYPPATRPSYAGAGRVQAPGPQWLWVEGCWYWNGNDWAWLEQQWMPPGGQMSYVGPAAEDRDDYCVFQPNQLEVLPVAMPWPPDIGIGIGYSVQEVVVHGEFGGRYPGGGSYTGGGVRDHRNDPPRRRNEVVPSVRGGATVDQPDYDIDEPYLGPGPAARPPVVSPPSHPRPPRPAAPESGPVAPPAPPVVTTPPRPSAPPQGPAEPPPRRIIHQPQPPISAPPSPPPPRPAAPVTRPSAPAPGPARPTPPPRAAPPTPAPPRAAPRPAQPTQPTRTRTRGR